MKIPGIEIISPNYPNPYPMNLDCAVTLNFDQRVSIKFETFDMQRNTNNSCSYDWLAVYDGDSSYSPMKGSKLCGYDIPRPVSSTRYSLTLVFHSDDTTSTYKQGFKIITDRGKENGLNANLLI